MGIVDPSLMCARGFEEGISKTDDITANSSQAVLAQSAPLRPRSKRLYSMKLTGAAVKWAPALPTQLAFQ